MPLAAPLAPTAVQRKASSDPAASARRESNARRRRSRRGQARPATSPFKVASADSRGFRAIGIIIAISCILMLTCQNGRRWAASRRGSGPTRKTRNGGPRGTRPTLQNARRRKRKTPAKAGTPTVGRQRPDAPGLPSCQPGKPRQMEPKMIYDNSLRRCIAHAPPVAKSLGGACGGWCSRLDTHCSKLLGLVELDHTLHNARQHECPRTRSTQFASRGNLGKMNVR